MPRLFYLYFYARIYLLIFAIINRASPSGKAPVFGTGIRGFESLRPSQNKKFRPCVWAFYFARRGEDSNDKAQWALAAQGPKGYCSKSIVDLRSKVESLRRSQKPFSKQIYPLHKPLMITV